MLVCLCVCSYLYLQYPYLAVRQHWNLHHSSSSSVDTLSSGDVVGCMEESTNISLGLVHKDLQYRIYIFNTLSIYLWIVASGSSTLPEQSARSSSSPSSQFQFALHLDDGGMHAM